MSTRTWKPGQGKKLVDSKDKKDHLLSKDLLNLSLSEVDSTLSAPTIYFLHIF